MRRTIRIPDIIDDELQRVAHLHYADNYTRIACDLLNLVVSCGSLSFRHVYTREGKYICVELENIFVLYELIGGRYSTVETVDRTVFLEKHVLWNNELWAIDNLPEIPHGAVFAK
jgi:hypothetical protein